MGTSTDRTAFCGRPRPATNRCPVAASASTRALLARVPRVFEVMFEAVCIEAEC